MPEVVYGKGSYTLTKEKVGTRYVLAAIRTLVDPADPKDIEQVHALQDAIKVDQTAAGKFEAPNWDQASQKKVRDALLVLATTMPDFRKAFGTKDRSRPDPPSDRNRRRLGRQPRQGRDLSQHHAGQERRHDDLQAHRQGRAGRRFWSVSLYDAEGYYEKNPYNAYSINSITGKKSADGSIAIQFGGCDGKIPNCLPIMKGWNYTVRLYRPRDEILNGKWKFPEPQPAS